MGRHGNHGGKRGQAFDGIDPDEIGMLIVGTEGSVDFGKPISTNLISALGIGNNVRNYETKHACYSGVAALDTAVNWVASGLNHGKKALVVSTDFSRRHFNTIQEFVMGGAAGAMIISDNPKILAFEAEKKGTWSTDIYDTFRPSARAEVGNNEVSLYSYMDALEGAWTNYNTLGGEMDFDNDFAYMLYHTPFPGMAFQAHRTLCNLNAPRRKPAIVEDFETRVVPSLRYSRRLGSTYGSSNVVGISALLGGDAPVKAGDRLGLYAYGSGAIGEYWSALVQSDARELVKAMNIDAALDSRRSISVEEYELIENTRNEYVENPDFTPDYSLLGDFYSRHYEGKGLYHLEEVDNWYGTYSWS